MDKYQVMPLLSDEEFEELKASIAEHGVQVPVEYDEEWNILDGYHRVRACKELGINDWPKQVKSGLSEDQKIEHALLVNMVRRHVSKEFKKEKAIELRKEGWTQQKISNIVGVPRQTISDWLNEFAEIGKLKQPEKIQGADGKQYPSTRERKPEPKSDPIPEPQVNCEPIEPIQKPERPEFNMEAQVSAPIIKDKPQEEQPLGDISFMNEPDYVSPEERARRDTGVRLSNIFYKFSVIVSSVPQFKSIEKMAEEKDYEELSYIYAELTRIHNTIIPWMETIKNKLKEQKNIRRIK